MSVLVLVETVLLGVLTVLVAGLLRAYATVLRRLHDLDQGASTSRRPQEFSLPIVATSPTAPAPTAAGPQDEFAAAHDVSGESLAGEVVSARIVDVEHDTLLLFLSSNCASCEVFWRELADPIALPAGTRLLVVAQSPAQESPADLADLAPASADVILSSQAWRDYEVPGSPHVVFVNGRTGRVRGEGTGQSLAQVSQLLARSTGDARFVTGRRADKPARDAELEAAVDRELLAAGIVPGDPRLYSIPDTGDAE